MAGETIAVFTKNRVNPAYEAARLGADRGAARLEARTVHYVPDEPDSVTEQIALVRKALADRPDAVLFVPVHATRMDEAVRRLADARIPVVNYLNRMASGSFVAFVGADDYALGRRIAAHLFRHLGGRGRVVLVEGMPDAVTSRERLRGFEHEARAWPGITVSSRCCGRYDRETGRSEIDRLLALGERPDGILCANDSMALGALDALARAGHLAAVAGVNALPEAVAAVASGALLATADFDTIKIACIAAEAAVRHLRGLPVPREIIVPADIVDRANCAGRERPLSRRECPAWETVVTAVR